MALPCAGSRVAVAWATNGLERHFQTVDIPSIDEGGSLPEPAVFVLKERLAKVKKMFSGLTPDQIAAGLSGMSDSDKDMLVFLIANAEK